ncbi:MAG: FecR domain-containing protein [Deltaproteobacteria bacterium]|jgi:hypothetical protein|nr:FecR domain-containing protein [Deltaproteobacteria bacterium]
MRVKGYIAILTVIWFLVFSLGIIPLDNEALAQEAAPTILQVAGKAQIIERGRRTPARTGQRLLAGQTIELVGGGEVRVATVDGRIKIRVTSDSTVRYDGEVEANSQPWTLGPTTRRAASGDTSPQFFASKGKLEIEVAPGQRLRLLCPLILAAVRGTVFTVTVEADGTSRVDTLEGQVATYGRQGEMTLTRPGQSVEVSARQYSSYLTSKGVNVPSGDWRRISENERQRVDNQTLSPIFSTNSDPLIAVLSNPNAAPNQGVQALALENSAVEPGSIFASELDSSQTGTTETRIIPASSDIDPQSTLLDEGLPDIIPPNVPAASQIGHVIGSFNLPGATEIVFNTYVFDLDFATGSIIKAGFDIEYKRTTSFGPVSTDLSTMASGSGYLNLNTLNFYISNFGMANSHYSEADGVATSSEGYLGSATTFTGSFLAPLNFNVSVSGRLTPEYVPTNGFNQTTMPVYYDATGILRAKPLLDVYGDFAAVSNLAVSVNNWFDFALDANDGRIYDGELRYLFYDNSSNDFNIHLRGASGQLNSNNFNVTFSRGDAESFSNTYNNTATGVLQGTLSSSAPAPGVQVTSGSLVVTYGATPPTGFPNTIPIQNGQVKLAGQ